MIRIGPGCLARLWSVVHLPGLGEAAKTAGGVVVVFCHVARMPEGEAPPGFETEALTHGRLRSGDLCGVPVVCHGEKEHREKERAYQYRGDMGDFG